MTIILGIDPGTKCGWSLRLPDGTHKSGVWDLSLKKGEGIGMRYVRLRVQLAHQHTELGGFDLLAYEDVRRHTGTTAGHVYGGIVAVMTEFCEMRDIPYVGVPVGTIKKFATGKGNANKTKMLTAALKKWPGFEPATDDEADARWIAECAAQQKGK